MLKLKRIATILLIIFIIVRPERGYAQSPRNFPPGVPVDFVEWRFTVGIQIKFASGFEYFNSRLLTAALNRMEHRVTNDMFVYPVFDAERSRAGVWDQQLQIFVSRQSQPLDNTTKTRVIEFLNERLNAKVKANVAMADDHRLLRVRELEMQESEILRKLSAFYTLKNVQSDAKELIKEKLQQLRQEVDRLKMEFAAKAGRREALAKAIDEQKAQTAKSQENDPISQELRKLMQLREEELQRRKQTPPGVMSRSDMAQAESAVSEAKIRLAEREASLSKSGRGELLDRLSDELTMLSVDVTDLELRIKRLGDELNQYNPQLIDAKGLDRIVELVPGLQRTEQTGNAMTRLESQLFEQLDQNRSDQFSLQVIDVEVPSNEISRPLERLGGPATQHQP